MSVVYVVAQVGLALAGAMIGVRLLRGPTTSDRIVALDTLLLVVVSLLAFVGTVTAARFLERRGGP